MKILLKYATRGRAVWFTRAIENITNTIKTDSYQILVSADLNDPTMNCDDVKSFVKLFPKVKIVYGFSKSKIDAINRDMEQADDWDLLINFSDDMKWMVVGWDEIMIKAHKAIWGESLDFFAHWNDSYVEDKLPTMSIMGREYYKRDNYIYYPEYRSFSCDAEAMYVAMTRGCHHYFPAKLFAHQHPTHSPMPQDETYRINSLHTPHDNEVYWRRLHADFGMKEEGCSPPFFWDQYKKR